MPDHNAPDPSMDEILASIRKIVSEDDQPASEGAGSQDDVLLLTERASPVPEVPMVAKSDDVAAASAGSAFDKLSAAREATLAARQGPAMPPPGRSLEDITRELLRPMLQAWLDEHLAGIVPEIVQERVDEEIARIARGRAR